MAHIATHVAVARTSSNANSAGNVDERSHTGRRPWSSTSNRSNSVDPNPSNVCLVSIRFGDGVEMFVNGDCCVTNFMHYIAQRMNQNGVTVEEEEYGLIELVDEEGSVRGIRRLSSLEHVSNYLQHRMLYIPVKLELNKENITMASKDDSEEDWQILLAPHDIYYNYIEEAMQNIKEARIAAKSPRRNTHGDSVSMKSRGSAELNTKTSRKTRK